MTLKKIDDNNFVIINNESVREGDFYYDEVLNTIVHWEGMYAPGNFNAQHCRKVVKVFDIKKIVADALKHYRDDYTVYLSGYIAALEDLCKKT